MLKIIRPVTADAPSLPINMVSTIFTRVIENWVIIAGIASLRRILDSFFADLNSFIKTFSHTHQTQKPDYADNRLFQ